MDTAADFVLVIICLIKLLPVSHVPLWLIIWNLIIAVIKEINLISGYVIRKEIVALHTVRICKKLESKYPEVKYVNRLMTHSWGQQVVRFYDPDGNLIEVGTPV